MAQVSLSIAGRVYHVACEDGHEEQVSQLGRELDRRAQALSKAAGAISEGVLLTLVGVMVADELGEAKKAAAKAKKDLEDLRVEATEVLVAAQALDETQERLEEMERVRGDLNQALAAARSEAEEAQKQRDEAQQRAATHEAELAALRGQIEVDQQVLAQEREEQQAEIAHLQASLASAGAKQDDQVQQEIQELYTALEAAREENAALAARMESVGGHEAALQTRVSELEGRLAEMKAALEAARMRLEQQRDLTEKQEKTQDAVAIAIESLAQRVETVAELLAEH